MKSHRNKFVAALAVMLLFAFTLAGCFTAPDAPDSVSSATTNTEEAPVATDGVSIPETQGSGTAENPYQISTAGELEKVADDLTAHYVLTEDIDLSGYENWMPIGKMSYDDVDMETGEMDMTKAFSGTFDGGGHTISNLTALADGSMLTIGLFGNVTGEIKNLALSDAIVDGGTTTMAAGGVIGYAMEGKVSNISLSGKSTITGTNCIGGIVGGNMADVDSCTVDGTEIVVVGDNDFSDGLVQCDIAECGGLIVGGGFTGSINHCTASGTVTATGNEPVGLGGIAGCIQCVERITGNTATVTINAKNGHAIGGLCGYAGMGDDGDGIVDDPCAITDCQVDVTINADGATHVGGLVGTGLYFYGMEDRFTVENCSVTGSINGAITPGTVAGRAVGSKIISCTTDIAIDGQPGDQQVGNTEIAYESADQYEDGSTEAATRLLDALNGTYEELFPVLTDEKYDQLWLDTCADIVGEENAEASAAQLKAACIGTLYGREAIDAYADAPEEAIFNCFFIEGIAQITVDGPTISGVDEKGAEIFSHTYSYNSYDEQLGFYRFKSVDGNEDAFTYFCFAPDTTARTHHIEFRYGSNLESLEEFREGPYAYWLAAGFQTDYDDTVVANCIKLFCKENLEG